MGLLLFCPLLLLQAVGASDWGYGEEDGPDKWPGVCQTGHRQSPVDIRVGDVDIVPFPRIYFKNYGYSGKIVLKNNGHTVIATGFEKWGNKRPYIYGGGLKDEYYLVQFHLHWSQTNNSGSEHTIGRLHYPVEIHFVHVIKGRSLDDGRPLESDTIAVVGVFAANGNNGSPFYAVEHELEKILSPGQSTEVDEYQPIPLLPSSFETFFRYNGSLTTPDCGEVVVWTVMSEPVSITALQLTKLRKVKFPTGDVGENYRPTQPLNGRRILFRSSTYAQVEDAAAPLFSSAILFLDLFLFFHSFLSSHSDLFHLF